MGVVTPMPVSPRPFLSPLTPALSHRGERELRGRLSLARGEGAAQISSPLMGEDKGEGGIRIVCSCSRAIPGQSPGHALSRFAPSPPKGIWTGVRGE